MRHFRLWDGTKRTKEQQKVWHGVSKLQEKKPYQLSKINFYLFIKKLINKIHYRVKDYGGDGDGDGDGKGGDC